MSLKVKIFSAIIMVLLLFAGYSAFRMYSFWQSIYNGGEAYRPDPDPVLSPENPDGRVNILLLGIDTFQIEGSRTDTIIIASYDPKTREASMLSIPRDSRVNIPGRGMDKINHAHAFGGIPLTVETVESFLDLKIHYYVRLNFQGFQDMVDILGGIVIDVEPSVARAVPGLEQGVQRLDGEKALAYVRDRKTSGGDLGRIERQQKFILAVLDQAFSVSNLRNLPHFMDMLGANFKTNIPFMDITRLSLHLLRLDLEEVEKGYIPGQGQYINGIYYLIVDEEGTRRLLKELNIR